MNAAKKWLIAIVVLCIGYSGLWYFQAYRLQKQIKKEIDKQVTPDGISYHYDALSLSGFPWNIQLTFSNPVLKSDQYEIHHIGSSINSFSLFGTLKTVQIEGKTEISSPQSAYTCTIEGKAMATLSSQTVHPLAFFNELLSKKVHDHKGSYTLTLSPLRVAFLTNGQEEMVLQTSYATFDFEKVLDAARQMIHFKSAIRNIGYQVAAADKENGPVSPETLCQLIFSKLGEKVGKGNFSIDFEASLPDAKRLEEISRLPFRLISQPVPEIRFTLNQLDFSNNFMSNHTNAQLQINEEESRTIIIDSLWHSQTNVTALCYDTAQEILDALGKKANYLIPVNQKITDMKKMLTQHLADIKAVIPKLHEFGTIDFAKEQTIQFNKETMNGKISLSQFALLTSLYGIRLHGALEYRQEFSGKLTCELVRYAPMIHDAVGYVNRLVTLLNHFLPEKEQPYRLISPEITDHILGYIRTICDAPASASDDVTVTIDYQGSTSKIGTLSMAQFQEATNKLITEIQNSMHPVITPQPAQKK